MSTALIARFIEYGRDILNIFFSELFVNTRSEVIETGSIFEVL